ncbi:L,D-transpeptidase family protein [Methylovirgula sp. 4M-Z18]|uniref:L,D-transpeptidase family protein n=1 Tax=Methylovirgula sp. 4M-Z18 TaxID=2293567 RepID=UPI000E2FAB69|nr:L,D-transpeptidase family protein [Methylovirgula sp. 4M-Z18]RFB78510.1 L,D-transpeptidase catalytic domain protein [Methylovirgula sp. 4M-Z18]
MTISYSLPRKSALLCRLRVTSLPGQRAQGRLTAGATVIRCALGPAGIVATKREGDGATPMGRFAILYGHFRPDQKLRPGGLNMVPQRRVDGWSDDIRSGQYNRPVRLPHRLSHEAMWRNDRLYDTVFVLDYNIRPRVIGRGSAIFFHLARPDYAPTAGCIAISAQDMRRLLPRLSRRAALCVEK